MFKKKARAALILSLIVSTLPVMAQNVASVNGVQIPDAQFDQLLSVAVARGQKDTPELRNALREELINREIIAQAAVRDGLDKTPEAKFQWAQIRENFLVELYLIDYSKKNPISDADVKAQYDREVAQLKALDANQEYNVSIIIVATAAEADAVIAQLKKGASFEKLAREKSIDPSKSQGGLVGWVLPSQINPEIGAEIKKLGKGAYAKTPIQTQAGWNIVKVDDKRAFKVPSFDGVKDRVRQSLVQQQRAALLNQLRQDAKIKQN